MSAKREGYSEAENISLVSQVSSVCPRCGIALFYTKGKKTFKQYQLAHIYPLNPRPEEEEILGREERLHADVNHPDNIIPLCGNCHGRFDKPRTVEEYRDLLALKKQLIYAEQQADLRTNYALELEVSQIVERLYRVEPELDDTPLSYDPKALGEKLRADISVPLRQKIKHNVADYYQFVRGELFALEEANPGVSDLILSQVRVFYRKQKLLGLTQSEIFKNVVAWVAVRTKPRTIEAAEIMVCFFVQNCEVFE